MANFTSVLSQLQQERHRLAAQLEWIALFGHSKPKTSRVKARISKTLSDHAVANSWWSPSSLPAWLNEEYTFRKFSHDSAP